jgi:hypothetical protein
MHQSINDDKKCNDKYENTDFIDAMHDFQIKR